MNIGARGSLAVSVLEGENELHGLFKYKKNNVILMWSLWYIAIMIIPLLFGIVNFNISKNSIESEINHSNKFIAHYLSSKVNNYIIENERHFNDIMLNKNMDRVSEITSGISDIQYEYLRDIGSFLSKIKIQNDIKSIAIFLKNIDIVIYSEGICSRRQYYDTYMANKMTYEEFLDFSITKQTVGFREIKDKASSVEDIVYLRNINSLTDSTYLGNVAIISDKYSFLHMEETEYLNFDCFIFNHRNEYVTGTNDTIRRELDVRQMQNNEGKFVQVVEGEPYLFTYVRVEDTKYVYLYSKNQKMAMLSLEQHTLFFYLCMLISLVTGVIIIYIAVKNNYKPISAIESYISRNVGGTDKSGYNIYANIVNNISSILNEKNRLQGVIEKQGKTLQSYYLAQALKGTLQNEEGYIRELIRDEQVYHAVVVSIDDCEDIFFEKGEFSAEENYECAQIAVGNILQECIQGSFDAIMITNVDGMLAMVCCGSADEDKLTEQFKEARELSKSICNIEFTIAVSSAKTDVRSMMSAYKEAMETFEHKLIYMENDVYFYHRINSEGSASGFYYPLSKEQQLIEAVKLADITTARGIADNLFEYNFGDKELNIQMFKCFTFNLAGTMIKAIDEISNMRGEGIIKLADDENLIESLLECGNLQDFRSGTERILVALCDFVDRSKPSTNQRMAEDIKNYIDENFSNENMNISTLADSFGFSRDYISKSFKQYLGISILDYIHKVRVDKAGDMLIRLGYTVAKTSKMVGYSNVSTFIRVFTKLKGVSPKYYKS